VRGEPKGAADKYMWSICESPGRGVNTSNLKAGLRISVSSYIIQVGKNIGKRMGNGGLFLGHLSAGVRFSPQIAGRGVRKVWGVLSGGEGGHPFGLRLSSGRKSPEGGGNTSA